MKLVRKTLLTSFMIRLGGLAATIVVAGGLLLTPSFSWADTQDDAAFTCSSAINVMDCIKQTGTGVPVQQSSATAVPINSQALGFTGPVSVGLRYDNYLAWILDVGYAQSFYNAAAAFKLSAGLNERRANVTLGYSITPKQQIKLTYEYLAQNLPFDYASGTVNEWVNQNAMGGAYRYLLDNGMVRALEVYGNYTKANSKELNEVEMYTDNVLTQIDYRRIAGGTQQNAGASVTLTPTKGTIIKVGAGYSSLSFDTKWEDNEANAVLAYNAEVSQLLTPTVLVSGGIGTTASGSTYTAKVSKILPWSLEASLIGQYMSATNDIPGSTSVTAGLSYPAPKTYTNMFSEGVGNLKDWVQQPVIYNTRVLAKAEEKLVQVQITKKADIPAQSVAAGDQLAPIQTQNYFAFDPTVYTKVEYKISSFTQKGEPNNTFDPLTFNLQLTVDPKNNYNEILASTGQMPASAMNPGNYTLTIQALGYRGSQVVSQLQNPVDISVTGNNALAAGTWNLNAKPIPAASNQLYPGTDLKTLVTDNSQLTQGDNFTFQLISVSGPSSPKWLTISSDGKSLIGVPGTVVPNSAENPTKVVLAGSSTVSNKPIVTAGTNTTQQEYDLVVNYSGTKPTWKSNTGDTLPKAYYSKAYADNSGLNYNIGSYIYSTGTSDNIISSLVYNCQECKAGQDSQQQLLPISGLVFYKNTGAIVGTPTDFTQITGESLTFHIVATNTSHIDSDPHPFTIQLYQNSGLASPAWTGTALPQTSVNNPNDYNTDLNNYISDNGLTGSLTYTVEKNSCKWLIWDSAKSNILSGKPSSSDIGTCTINITASSSASGSSSPFNDKPITVLSSGVFSSGKTIPNATYQQPYYQQSGAINLNDGSYFSDGDSTDTFNFTPVTLPPGMTLSSDGKLQGTPADINSIDSTTLQFTVKSVKNPDTINPLTYTAPNFKVEPNNKLPFSATWISAKLPLPSANVKVSYPNVNVNDYFTFTAGDVITGYHFVSNSCSDWLQLDSKTGILSGGATPQQAGTCTFVISVDSKATGLLNQKILNSDQSDTQTITVVSNAPVWKADNNTFYMTIPYPSSTTTITLDDEVNDSKDVLFSDLTSLKDFPAGSTMMPKGITTLGSTRYVYIGSPSLVDVNNSLPTSGAFTVLATRTGETSTGTFNIKVTATVTNPAGNGTLLSPVIQVGQDYPTPVNIDPYLGNPAYMTPTQVTGSNGKENLPTDSLTLTARHDITGGTAPDCDWASLKDGQVIGHPESGKVQPPICNLNFDVYSARSNQTTTTFVPVPIAVPVIWNQDLIQNLQLQFDATQDLYLIGNVTALDLSSLVNQDPTQGTIQFTLTTNDADNNFIIINNKLLLNNPTDGNLKGNLAGTKSTITVTAQSTWGTPTPQGLTINFINDPNVTLAWDSTTYGGCSKATLPDVTQPLISGIVKYFSMGYCIKSTVYGKTVVGNNFSFGSPTSLSLKATNAPNNPYSTPPVIGPIGNPPDPQVQISYPTPFDMGQEYNLIINNVIGSAGSPSPVTIESGGPIITVPNNLIVNLQPSDNIPASGFYSDNNWPGTAIYLTNMNPGKDYVLQLQYSTTTGPGKPAWFYVCPGNVPGNPVIVDQNLVSTCSPRYQYPAAVPPYPDVNLSHTYFSSDGKATLIFQWSDVNSPVSFSDIKITGK